MANFDEDYVLALQLQEQMNAENTFDSVPKNDIKSPSLVDPYWEMTDPNPDVRALFLQFNDRFFWGKLAGIEVRWSPRMTLCAGLCCYEGRGGLCSVRLSVPLLKLRPRKDLVETLLHEMIHAYLFVTDNNKDHDGHGPEFHKHMYRINKEAGTNITVYHDFHDEVNSYRQHWWRCDGPCRDRKPYYGYVKRTMNRAPSKNDTWWAEHQRTCGGTYTKVKEPEDYGKKKGKDKESKDNKKEVKPSVKSMDIRVFGGKGVTLSGSKSNSSGNTPSSAVSIPSKKPPSATVTSDIEVDKSDNSPSMLSSLSKSASNSKGKELLNSNTFINNRESTEDQNNLPALPELPGSNKINSTNARGVIQSKFADSDFSDSDDDLLLSASEEHISGKFTDTGSSKISGEKGTREKVNNILFDNDMQAPKAVTSDDSNDVRAMLRKVWGEKNIGTGNKKKVVPKKFTGTISRIQGKSDPLNVTGSIKNKGSFRSPAFVNGKKVHSGSEINRPKPSVIGVDKKRPSTIDHHDDMPESKRLKKEISSCSEQIETETELNRHSTKPGLFDDKVSNQFPDAFSGLKIKNDDKFPDKQECDRRGDKSQVFNKVRTSEELPSPEQDIKAKSMCPIKSPIERLFDKVKERQTANVNIETSDCDIDMVRETNVVNSEAVSIFREIKDISSCPVCNKGVPTATINEHLDLCLTLKVL